jgi:radical SAM superfamily enzyme YgiQ (UPF0313 family)
MHTALVATYTHPVALGLRYISAYLKAHGQPVTMFFMRSKRDTAEADFSPALLAELAERLRDVGVIGMSVMTNTFHRACRLTDAIREADVRAPIVWGGPHPSLAIEESLGKADLVCRGEGEQPMLQVVEALEAGGDPTTAGSLAFRRNGRIVQTPVHPLPEELDELPFPDFDLDSHWVAMGDHFERATPGMLRGVLDRYRIETTRGCPYSCAFCTNTAMAGIHAGKGKWVRKRSNENVVRELESIRARFPTVEAVNIIDDLFFIRSEAEMEDFSRLYAQRVNLPLELDAHPNVLDAGKLRALASLPIALVSMGIQSGSRETLRETYHRVTELERIVDGINLLADRKILAEYHYLVNNPFESDGSRIETLRFAATHHRGPAILRIFPLQFYPGTPLYDRARGEGVIEDRHESAYRFTYTGKTHLLLSGYLDIWLRVVLNLRNAGIPSAVVHRLVDVVTSRPVRFVLDRRWFAPSALVFYRVGRFITHKLIYQPFVRPFRRLRRKGRRGALDPAHEPGAHKDRSVAAA